MNEICTPRDEVGIAIDSITASLYKHMCGRGENVVLSPFSIAVALLVTASGARRKTERDMKKFLGIAHSPSDVLMEIAHVRDAVSMLPSVTFSSSDAAWVQADYELLKSFTSLLAASGVETHSMDFSDKQSSAANINSWAHRATSGMIPTLLSADALSDPLRFMITNAVYFKGLWAHAFDATHTRKDNFHSPLGIVEVDMMQANSTYSYYSGPTFSAVAIPYLGDAASMVIILPHKMSGVDDISACLREIDEFDMMQREVQLGIPKFKVEWGGSIAHILKLLGLTSMFSPEDFYGIVDYDIHPEGLMVDDVIHKAVVEVDEAGTIAAAATVVSMGTGACYGDLDPIRFIVDRPFGFAIRVDQTLPLFVGNVANPI